MWEICQEKFSGVRARTAPGAGGRTTAPPEQSRLERGAVKRARLPQFACSRSSFAIIFLLMAKGDQPAQVTTVVSASPRATIDLSSFELESCTLEVRYPFALALWDRSGQLWKAVQEKWPELSPIHVEPTKTDFRVGNTRLVVEFEQARIVVFEPERSLDQFLKDSKEFVRITTQYLQIATYKRIGFRLVYFKEFKDKKDAAAAFFSLGLVRVPDGKRFILQCRAETRVVAPFFSFSQRKAYCGFVGCSSIWERRFPAAGYAGARRLNQSERRWLSVSQLPSLFTEQVARIAPYQVHRVPHPL